MATITEIRQELVQGGMDPISAQQAAKILADQPPLTAPSGGVFDTLVAKGYRIIPRPANINPRFFTDDKTNLIVITKAGLNTIFAETAIESL